MRSPYVILVAALSLLLLVNPAVPGVWMSPSPPWWLGDVTILVGLLSVWLFVRALLVSQLQAMTVSGEFGKDPITRNLLAAVLARTGVCALWATLMVFLLMGFKPIPAGAKVTDLVGTYATVGAIIGLAGCAVKSCAVQRESFRRMKAAGSDGMRNRIRAHVVCAVCDLFVLGSVITVAGRLAKGFGWIS
ncbi:hypothetical protein ACQPYK_08885 [Streptosporangium sp. CA-135522]|uniref:hypothetical protein n=1 Tax=Streptosporangium sp. CA-135522 TaxID=3240072 RepID=UPI003D919E2D